MKKDIPNPEVTDIAVAIAPRTPGEQNKQKEEIELWDVYIINLKDEPIHSVLINSYGYGEIGGEARKTSTLRHFFEAIGPLDTVKIEPIPSSLFEMTNVYWISFYFDGIMHDKKFVFEKGSINKEEFFPVPFINKYGVIQQ